MNLYPISLTRLTNIEAGQFIDRMQSDIASLSINIKDDAAVEDLVNNLKEQSLVFNKALQQIKAQQETDALLELDLIRDHALIAIDRQILVYEFSLDAEVKKAFREGTIVQRKYDDLKKVNYEAETKGIKLMIDEWKKAENKDYVNLLHLADHIKNLEIAAADFNKFFDNRQVKVISTEVYKTKELRKPMMETYTSLVNYVAATSGTLKYNDYYKALISGLNGSRKYFADILAKRKSSVANSTPPSTPPSV